MGTVRWDGIGELEGKENGDGEFYKRELVIQNCHEEAFASSSARSFIPRCQAANLRLH